MIRYRLFEPADGDATLRRREAEVSLPSRYGDELADVNVFGESDLAERIAAALLASTGRWNKPLGRRTTPRDLAEAMTDPPMRPFEPLLLEGEAVFALRQPPPFAPEELDRVLAEGLGLLALTLPLEPLDPSLTEGEQTAERLALFLFEWPFSQLAVLGRDEATHHLAALLAEEVAANIDRWRRAMERHDTYLRDRGQPAIRRLVRYPIGDASWWRMASELVELFGSAAADADATSLMHDFQRRLAALGLSEAAP